MSIDNNIIRHIAILVLSLSLLSACRESGDDELNYRNIGDANNSMEMQFKAFWSAMNSNYPIWDYESTDWDAVYQKYVVLFRKADNDFAKVGTKLSDSLFAAYYQNMMGSLHDGHTQLTIKNFHSGNEFNIRPVYDRIVSKKDWANGKFFFSPKLDTYVALQENDANRLTDFTGQYGYQCGVFGNSISYLRLAYCDLPKCFNENDSNYNDNYSKDARMAWTTWFQTIQEMHKSGKLKGVIIDVRSNTGGDGTCSKYVFGSLHNKKFENLPCYKRGWIRKKCGAGRLDFLSKTPALWESNTDEHATITEPIVVLANNFTASTAEHICLDAKEMDNAYVIGTQTFGAFSPTSSHQVDGGNVMEMDKYGFELMLPNGAFFTESGEVLEGKGVAPDIEIRYDEGLFNKTGRDNQLEHALEFIRNKK